MNIGLSIKRHEIARDYIQILRARAERFRQLAGKVDAETAAIVAGCAAELESEVQRLERHHRFPG